MGTVVFVCPTSGREVFTGLPIMSVAAKDAHLDTLNHHLRAIAIVFDFMNPVLSFWRMIDRGSKLRLDKPEPGSDAEHWG